MRSALVAAALALLAPGCKDPGDPCQLSVRGGRVHDPCATRCLDAVMTCPDGVHTNPGVCAGARCQGDEDCAAGFLCLPYEEDEGTAFCAPRDVCFD
ncbi:MAG: hypothetical protein KC549_01625 [Myxococcales bacterium]|nr:hypothetical protein [Myxococcales bacterium]